jgi:hypothetical protein
VNRSAGLCPMGAPWLLPLAKSERAENEIQLSREKERPKVSVERLELKTIKGILVRPCVEK